MKKKGFKWFLYYKMEKYLKLNYWIANKTYSFRKYVYLNILKLDVCHFCLHTYEIGGKIYCISCCAETL